MNLDVCFEKNLSRMMLSESVGWVELGYFIMGSGYQDVLHPISHPASKPFKCYVPWSIHRMNDHLNPVSYKV